MSVSRIIKPLRSPLRSLCSSNTQILSQWCLQAADLGGFEGVVWREGDVQEEDAALVHGARRSQDGRPPLVDVVSFGAGAGNRKEKFTLPVQRGEDVLIV